MGQYQPGQATKATPAGLVSGNGYLGVAPAAGSFNNFNPGGIWPAVAILDFDTTLGDVSLTGLLAGSNNQMICVGNKGPNNLNLDNQNAGSLAANRFRYAGDLQLVSGESVVIIYSTTLARWIIC